MRAGTRRALSVLIASIASGCAMPPTVPPGVVLRVADGTVWIYAEDIGRFRREIGLLTCDAAVGRTSQRRCRCLE